MKVHTDNEVDIESVFGAYTDCMTASHKYQPS